MPGLLLPSVETTSLKPFPMPADKQYGDFRDALVNEGEREIKTPAWIARDLPLALSSGFVVVPGVLSHEESTKHVSAAHGWLESFGLGYNRDHPSTYRTGNLPSSFKGELRRGCSNLRKADLPSEVRWALQSLRSLSRAVLLGYSPIAEGYRSLLHDLGHQRAARLFRRRQHQRSSRPFG